MIQIFHNPAYDFIGKRRWAYLASAIILLVCLASLTVGGGLRYGIDFAGGTLVQLHFEQAPSIEQIRAAFSRMGVGESIIQQYGDSRDFVARLGGDEFGLLLTGVDEHAAFQVADRIRRSVLHEAAGGILVTASLGFVLSDHHPPNDWMRLADDALRAAKSAGRNRTVAAPA